MTISQASILRDGLYFVHWIDGGGSVAAIGRDNAGMPWIAPTNWLTIGNNNDFDVVRKVWASVLTVELITTQKIELNRRNMERD